MNPQCDLTNGQTSRSLVEDVRVQSSTNEVGPSTGQEEQRNGAAGPGASGSSGAELQRRLKVVKLSGNEHFSLVRVEDESKVVCLIFPFPVDRTAQVLGGRDATAMYRLIDEERCQIVHTLAGSHFLPVKVAMQLVAALRSMRADDMLQLSRHRPVTEGSNRCDVVDLKLYNGRLRGWDFETDDEMTKEKRKLLDTGRVIRQDIRVRSAPVPSSELTRFHMCGPPDCNFEEIRECSQRIGELNYAGLHQRLTKMQVVIPTSTVQVQTENDVTVSASQTDEMPITFEIKKRVLLELGMSAELAEACIESPEELCRRLQDFTDHQPSSSYQRTVEVQMESDSDDDSAASTATAERRVWELEGDEPQNEENENERQNEEDEPEDDDDRNNENDERNVVPNEEP